MKNLFNAVLIIMLVAGFLHAPEMAMAEEEKIIKEEETKLAGEKAIDKIGNLIWKGEAEKKKKEAREWLIYDVRAIVAEVVSPGINEKVIFSDSIIDKEKESKKVFADAIKNAGRTDLEMLAIAYVKGDASIGQEQKNRLCREFYDSPNMAVGMASLQRLAETRIKYDSPLPQDFASIVKRDMIWEKHPELLQECIEEFKEYFKEYSHLSSGFMKSSNEMLIQMKKVHTPQEIAKFEDMFYRELFSQLIPITEFDCTLTRIASCLPSETQVVAEYEEYNSNMRQKFARVFVPLILSIITEE